jgi:hypothetical protein
MILGLVALSSSSVWSVEAISSAEPGPIPYSTIDEALKDLHAKAGVTFRNQDGWIVAEDLAASAAWLITPPGHPAAARLGVRDDAVLLTPPVRRVRVRPDDVS